MGPLFGTAPRCANLAPRCHNGLVTAETDAARIARRYPRPRLPRWGWIPLAVALALVGGAWLLWSATVRSNPPVSGQVTSFSVVSDTEVQATLTVQRPDPSVAARCTLVAQAVTYERVGQLPVEIAPSGATLETHSLTIRTFKRATSVWLEGCVPLR